MLRRSLRSLSTLKEVFASTIPATKQRIGNLLSEHGNTKISDVTVQQVLTGMRGVPGLVTETSRVDPQEGIRFRGYSIPECQRLLPAYQTEPMPESLFWLLLTGQIPTKEQVESLRIDLNQRALQIPQETFDLLDRLPSHMHPMTQFSIGVLSCGKINNFYKGFFSDQNRSKHWEYVYEDALNLVAWTPLIAARIFRNTYYDGKVAQFNPDQDMGANFGRQLGYEDPDFHELMRLYLVIHSDHEGGNVSAHTTHLVGTSLASVFRSFAAGLNGLAGPLHGLANQECLKWLLWAKEKLGDNVNHQAVEVLVKNTLDQGKVVPGYGHAVLRNTDPRFKCQLEFGEKIMPDDPLFQLMKTCFEVIPGILKATGKVSNPWPNVDAASGTLLWHYDLKQYEYYTVLFGVARTMGVMANAIWVRAMNISLERPISISLNELEELTRN